MAKRKKHRERKKLTFKDIIKGNFLHLEEIRANYKYFLFLSVLVFITIYLSHMASNKIKQVNQLKEQVEEYKSRNAYAQSCLIKVKMESELGKEMEKDSLFPLEKHPHKLLIKIDSTNGKK